MILLIIILFRGNVIIAERYLNTTLIVMPGIVFDVEEEKLVMR